MGKDHAAEARAAGEEEEVFESGRVSVDPLPLLVPRSALTIDPSSAVYVYAPSLLLCHVIVEYHLVDAVDDDEALRRCDS